MHVDLQLYAGRVARHRDAGRDARAYGEALAADYARYTAGTAMLETAERLHRGGAGARRPAVPAARRRAARARRGRARRRPGPRRVPAALAGGRRLRAVVRRLRPLRRAGPAPVLRRRGRRCGVRRLPAGRLRCTRRAETLDLLAALLSGDWAVADASDAAAPSRRRAGSSRPTCSGTSSAACARCRTSSASTPPVMSPLAGRRTESQAAPEAAARARSADIRCGARPPAIPRDLVPRHVAIVMDGNGRWAKAARPAADRRATRRARRRCSTSSTARSRSACRTSPRTRSRPRTGTARPTRSASSWASTATSSGAAATS